MTCHAGAGSRKAGHVLVTAGSRAGVSAQVYHTARMQRVFATRFSGDGAYVFSGSDDMNVRVWKVRARRVSPALRIPLEWGACVVCTLLWRSEPAGLVCQLAALRMLRSSSLFLVGVLPYQGMPVSLRMAACVYPGLQQKVSPDVARALAAQAQASAQQGTLLPRERHKAAYQAALVQRFRHLPEVKRIERHRHLPAALYKVRAGGSGRRSIGRVGARMHDRRGGKPPGLLVCAVERQCHQPAVLCIARVVEGKRE